jgi:hypothetical protein
MKIVVVVLFLSAISVFGRTQTLQNQTQQHTAFVRVERIGEASARSFFVFSTPTRNYAIRHDGHGEGSSNTLLRKYLNLKMEGATRLEQVFYAEYETDLLVQYEVTDLKSNWAYLLRLDQKTMKVKWLTSLVTSSQNLGRIDGQHVYFIDGNQSIKIDLQTGKSP